jgi:hypothetical protein
MNTWFTVKVKYTKQLDDGTFKRVSEPYLLAAMTFTDAEARIYEELGSIIRGEFTVTNIARTEYHDIFYYEDADLWYKCKVTYQSEGDGLEIESDLNPKKVKKVSQNFLVTATSVKEAFERIQESLSTLMVDYQIPSIILTPIVDIFPFNEELDVELERKPAKEKRVTEVTSEEEEVDTPGKGVVFSASGSDFDDEEEEEFESTLEDDFSGEEE